MIPPRDTMSAEAAVVTWAVGSTNKAKVEAVRVCVTKCFPTTQHILISTAAPSGVSNQPMSADECITGATNRANHALEQFPDAHYGVGLEGGLEVVGGKYFECGWMCVVDRATGRVGLGSSARFQMSPVLMRPILEEGKELAEVMDRLTGATDVRSGLGAMGVLTGGYLGRAEAYMHGLMFALAPFLSERKYWEE